MKSPKATVLEIILAILLPPVAVAIHEGITWRFWVSILLWILGILPGIIFALLIVTDNI
ncbi:MAG: YqaE/Pmp3 family membrane protein [Chitinophagaceae bacterium]|nr:MAG: YqaE/Pmp3 family membrane protein [Chitinophagaceae bacterium]